MQIISIYDYLGRSGSWHKVGRSSRLAEARVMSWFWRPEGRSAETRQ